MTKKLKVRLEDRGQGDVTVHLPALPEGMSGEHEIIFEDGDRVIFGLVVYRYEKGDIRVELFDPDKVPPVHSHEFKEKRGRRKT